MAHSEVYELKNGTHGHTQDVTSRAGSNHGLDADEAELAYFGKKQKLRRNFGMVSIIALTCTLMITWEGILIVFGEGFENGGPLGLFCSFIYAWIGTMAQAIVMAEMGSMIPLAGGQYNWVSILAPPKYSKFLSYMTGWITALVWQSLVVSGTYLVGSMIQGAIETVYPDTYVPKQWQLLLLIYAVIAFSIVVNTILARILPQVESIILIVHVLGFFGILIPLTYLAPHGTTTDVFGTWINAGLWSSRGLTFFIGSTGNIFCFIGVDAASHMAEEIENASYVIPRAMIASNFINGLAGFGMLIAVLFCLGNPDDAFKAMYPFMEIFQQAVRSTSGAVGMITVIIFVMGCATIGAVAAASRMLWAFSRERAVPGHAILSRVNSKTNLPLWSIAITAIINILLALINLGSQAVFNAFTSLTIGGYFTVYFIAASCLLWRRLNEHKTPLRYGSFSMGRAGIPIIIFSLLWSVLVFFWSFWPQLHLPELTLPYMNWSVVVYVAVVAWSLAYWVFWAKGVYTGPVMETTEEEYLATKEGFSS